MVNNSVGNAVTVLPLHWLLLNEAPVRVHPKMAIKHGLTEAIFLCQLFFWRKRSSETCDGEKVVRFSYTRWQRQLPFLTRRRVIDLVLQLEEKGVIKVHREGRVNRIALRDIGGDVLESDLFDDKYQAVLPVFGTLAKVVGLRAAIILQQVHFRTKAEPDAWARKSMQEWHDHCLMFISLRTLKRIFPELVKNQLLLTKPVNGANGSVNGYRVNYDRLATLLAGEITHAKVIDFQKTKWLKDALDKGIPVSHTNQINCGPVRYV